MTDELERDELLLNSLMDLVPEPGNMQSIRGHFVDQDDDVAKRMLATLDGYGTLINVIQAAVELGELLDNATLYDRLSAAYYELTNNDGDPDAMIRLRDDD